MLTSTVGFNIMPFTQPILTPYTFDVCAYPATGVQVVGGLVTEISGDGTDHWVSDTPEFSFPEDLTPEIEFNERHATQPGFVTQP